MKLAISLFYWEELAFLKGPIIKPFHEANPELKYMIFNIILEHTNLGFLHYGIAFSLF